MCTIYIRTICLYCLLKYSYEYSILISSREERRNADGQENRQAGEDCKVTHTTCLRDWNSHSSNQNDYREYPIGSGEGNLPYLKNNIVYL